MYVSVSPATRAGPGTSPGRPASQHQHSCYSHSKCVSVICMTTEGLARPNAGASAVKTPIPGGSRPVDSARTPPIKYSAIGGLLVVLLMVYVWGKWITGPNFKRVPAGPTPAPDWMIDALRAFEIGGLVLAAFVIWRFVVRPW